MAENTKEIIREWMRNLYAQATDPERYILHREHSKVLLFGVCIIGRLVGVSDVREYYLTARTALEREPKLGRALLSMDQRAALLAVTEQLTAVIMDSQEAEHVRYEYLDILDSMSIAALYVGFTEAEAIRQSVNKFRIKLREEMK